MKYCPNCKREAGDDMVFCMLCGTKLQEKQTVTEKEKAPKHSGKTQWRWILIATILCVWAVAMTALYIDTNDSKEYYYDAYREWKAEARELQDQVDFMDKFVVLVFDDGSDYYHAYECYEKYSGSFWAYNIDAAESKGYVPCPNCH